MNKLVLKLGVFCVAVFLAIWGFLFWVEISQPKELPIAVSKPININADKLMALINDWRVKTGLQPYIRDERLCAIAQDRVTNDPVLDNHAGLYKKYSSYPYVIQENLGTDVSEEGMLTGWLNSPAHAAVLHKSYAYTCVACRTNYCSEIFSSFLKN